jgi:hypothetical protein
MTCLHLIICQLAEFLQPGKAIGIVERLPAPHFLHVLRRMKIVRIEKPAIHPFGQQPADGRFA